MHSHIETYDTGQNSVGAMVIKKESDNATETAAYRTLFHIINKFYVSVCFSHVYTYTYGDKTSF